MFCKLFLIVNNNIVVLLVVFCACAGSIPSLMCRWHVFHARRCLWYHMALRKKYATRTKSNFHAKVLFLSIAYDVKSAVIRKGSRNRCTYKYVRIGKYCFTWKLVKLFSIEFRWVFRFGCFHQNRFECGFIVSWCIAHAVVNEYEWIHSGANTHSA